MIQPMNPQEPSSFNHRTAELTTGRTYHFVDQTPQGFDSSRTTTLLCLHGFPDLWYGWRNQIGPWTKAGYRVVVPSMLGYGGTDKPFDASEYSTKKICSDLAALLDFIEVKQAVVIGHDWGSFTAARFALWHPDRLTALAILAVPYSPPSPVYLPIEEVAARVPDLGYQVYFASHESTSAIESKLRRFIRLLFRQNTEDAPSITKPGELKALLESDFEGDVRGLLLTATELEYYLSEFKKGMNGPLNYYRTSKYRHDEEAIAKLSPYLRADLPVLCIYGTEDPTSVARLVKTSHKFIPLQQDLPLIGCGHWLMLEAKDEITTKILSWLDGLSSEVGKEHSKGKL